MQGLIIINKYIYARKPIKITKYTACLIISQENTIIKTKCISKKEKIDF